MRLPLAFALAAGLVLAAGNAPLAQDKKAEKPKPPDRPPLDAKEWKKLPSGLEVWDVKEGKGDAAAEGGVVTVHYTGWLTDAKATVFDSSVGGDPITFGLDDVIKGWTQGIPGMKPGGVRRLRIPPELAYGNRRVEDIPPNSALVFEVELVKVVPLPSLPDLKAKEWKKLPSGVEVWDVKEGKGDDVKAGATVTIHYTGWLTTGKVFDSSLKRGEPATFPLNNLIKGWQVGIPGMKPGGVRRLRIPPALAYGNDPPGSIPADSTLIFEIELLK